MFLEFKMIELATVFLALYVMVFFLLLTFNKFEDIVEESHELKKYRTISVLVPAWNEEKMLEKCVNSLLQSNYPSELLDIIIIDDGSTDSTPKIGKRLASEHKNVRYFRKENSGKADSLNFGLEKAKGELVAVLDADTIVDKDAIRYLASHFDGGADAVVPVAKVLNPSKNIITRLQQVEYLFTAFVRRVLQQIDSVYVTPGTFSMYRTEVLRKLGGFDVNNLLEDQEIAMRMQSHNYKIEACLEALVYTEVPENFGALLKQRERWHRGGLRNAFKYLHLIHPKYGDLGVLIMPLSVVSIVLMLSLIFIVLYVRVANPPTPATAGLFFDPSFLLGIVLFILTLVWTYLNLRAFEEKLSPTNVVLYLLSYAYFISFVWIVSIGKEIVGLKATWR